MRAPLGVLLMAYGTPAGLDEVEPYYTDIRRGRPPPPELVEELTERYRLVGGRTPLLEISRLQAAGVQRELGSDYRVFLGMKHWHPYIRQAVDEMREAGVERAVGIVLAPHYSRGSIGEYRQRVDQAQTELEYKVPIQIVESWHLNPHYLRAVSNNIRETLSRFDDPESVTVVFTAHSLPVRVAAGYDPYQGQLLETSRALAASLEIPDQRWTFSFQSAGRTADPWLGPDILETIERLGAEGVRNVLVAPVGFIADHLEIFYDIDHEASELAARLGLNLKRMPSLNAHPELIAALASLAREALT
ncbi:MAG TPA: ferrochelatase [Chloroflexota bacterium]|nr:ferrochelatase [Chloroflexota bacterium]